VVFNALNACNEPIAALLNTNGEVPIVVTGTAPKPARLDRNKSSIIEAPAHARERTRGAPPFANRAGSLPPSLPRLHRQRATMLSEPRGTLAALKPARLFAEAASVSATVSGLCTKARFSNPQRGSVL
jgi:hypothetical protein